MNLSEAWNDSVYVSVLLGYRRRRAYIYMYVCIYEWERAHRKTQREMHTIHKMGKGRGLLYCHHFGIFDNFFQSWGTKMR